MDQQQQQQRRRTVDVTTGAAGFEELMLPRWLLDGLAAAGFIRHVHKERPHRTSTTASHVRSRCTAYTLDV